MFTTRRQPHLRSISPHTSPHLPASPHISPHLPTPPHTSHISPHLARRHAAPALQLCVGERHPADERDARLHREQRLALPARARAAPGGPRSAEIRRDPPRSAEIRRDPPGSKTWWRLLAEESVSGPTSARPEPFSEPLLGLSPPAGPAARAAAARLHPPPRARHRVLAAAAGPRSGARTLALQEPRSRGHALSRTRPYSAVLTVSVSLVLTRCSEDSARHRAPAPRLADSARRLPISPHISPHLPPRGWRTQHVGCPYPPISPHISRPEAGGLST